MAQLLQNPQMIDLTVTDSDSDSEDDNHSDSADNNQSDSVHDNENASEGSRHEVSVKILSAVASARLRSAKAASQSGLTRSLKVDKNVEDGYHVPEDRVKERLASQEKADFDAKAVRATFWPMRAAAAAGDFHRGRRSAGYSDKHTCDFYPPAVCRELHSAATIHDAPKLEVRRMGAKHFLWQDKRCDNMISFSKSTLFVYIHAIRKHILGADDISVFIFDRRRAHDFDNRPAQFNDALDLCGAFPPEGDASYLLAEELEALQRRKLNHELIVFGPIQVEADHARSASMEDLLECGLRKLFPGLPEKIPVSTSKGKSFRKPAGLV